MGFIKKFFTVLLLSQFVISPAHAGSEIAILIEMLHQNGTVSDAQYGRLVAELKQNKMLLEEKQQTIELKLAEANDPSDVKVQIKGGGLALSTRDGAFTTKLGGRVQVDAARYGGEPESGDGTEVRRAYLTLQGTMYHDWGYRLQYNFANTGPNGKAILDAFIDYKGLEQANLRVGNFKEPFTLHEATSDNFITFTERAMIAAFSPGRRIGVMASKAERNWTWAAGLFGEGVSTRGGTNDEGWGISARTTYAPVNEQGRLIHIGLGANFRDSGGANAVRFMQRPESHVTDVLIVDTGIINDANDIWKWGAELATVQGAFSAQAEYVSNRVNRSGLDNLDFDGWYLETGYFLTGESRQYKNGRFGKPKPKANVGQGGIGAWQLALRYSTLDLSDGLVDGGEADVVSVGLNWYPTPTLRFTANYENFLKVDGGPNDGNEPNVFQVRSQWAF
jgi:phosphate-selective porin OprO/OprP